MIWCVEDDASILDIEVYTLQSTGFQARGFADGTAFWSAIGTAQELPELVVLDVMLPGRGRGGVAAPPAGRPGYPLHPRGHGHSPGGGI